LSGYLAGLRGFTELSKNGAMWHPRIRPLLLSIPNIPWVIGLTEHARPQRYLRSHDDWAERHKGEMIGSCRRCSPLRIYPPSAMTKQVFAVAGLKPLVTRIPSANISSIWRHPKT